MKIKPYIHINKNLSQNKKFNFTKILKNKSIFKNPSLIKQALSKGTISTKNYELKKLGKKIHLNKIESKSLELKKGNREIPYELLNILEKREKQYNKINSLYQSLKKENDTFLSYWHYTKKIKEKLEKLNNEENDSEKEEENEDYKKISKMYAFSNRDKIEMDLQKNLSKNIFKSNPLIINNNNEMYFHFLGETTKSENKSVNFNEQNSSRYLIKVKDFLEYISILKDETIDDLNKKIKLTNCNFTQYQDKKIEEENLKLLEEKQKNEIKEISESKRMIRYTKSLLNKLDKNKDYLEDPNYFTFYRKYNIKALTPNRKLQHKIMNKSSRSDFFVGDRNHFLNKDKYDTMRILKLKKNNLSKQLSSLLNESNNKKSKRIKKLRINNINPLFEKNNNESFSKDNNNSTFNMNFYQSKISNNYNNSTNSVFIQRYNNKKILPSIKSYFPHNAFTKSSNSNSMHQPVLVEENKIESKIRDSVNLDNTIKELQLNLNENNETNNNIGDINNSDNSVSSLKNNERENENDDFNKNENDIENNNENNKETEGNNEEENNNENKNNLEEENKNEKENNNEKEDNKENDNNKYKEESNKKIIIISDLYEQVKGMKKLNNEKIKEIDTYIHQQDIEYKRSKNTVNLINDVQLVLDEFDINKIAKNFSDTKNKEYIKIKTFKKMDKKLKKLDKKYIKDIIQFKARNMKNDYKFNS